jgi:two-component system, NtrC family, C4-dicarboxylate transport response regulator DctD
MRIPAIYPGSTTVDIPAVRDAVSHDDLFSPAAPHLLVLDGDGETREQLERLYVASGYSVLGLASASDCIRRLTEDDIDFIISSIHLPDADALELIAQIHQKYPALPVVAITSAADIQSTVDVLKLGACDFVVKPFDPAAVLESTRAALENSKSGIQARQLRRWLKDHFEFGDILSPTPQMRRVFELICTAAPVDMPVMIAGEAGTLKEQVAFAIHHHSARRSAPFVAVNCAGYPDALLQAELFGYEKNAFAGINESKPGKIAQAHGGTLFLDEIEVLSLMLQKSLLEVIDHRKISRLGTSQAVHVDVRIIAATKVSLKERAPGRMLRDELLSRLSAVAIELAPLRERAIDIPHLIENFLRYHPVAKSKRIAAVADKVLGQLMRYSWPGNVRELHNILECAILLATGRVIEDVKLPESVEDASAEKSKIAASSLRQWLREKEKYYLSQKLEDLGGNISLTAQSCRIGVRTLSRKMRTYGLDKRVFKEKPFGEKSLGEKPAAPPRERTVPAPKSGPA